ncbi:MAG: glutamate--tRNA ligase [Elusimicrobiota bacterium]|nr:glutamate--tRNA ligase [Endomicrobiia bacterium]MDW8165471.1 glutamate--tRNA ligase [Elusimicrobiota bacterium]
MTVRVRFAPSPTGFLHIGGLRTALFNYLFAKHNKGSFILRIEDTDRTRYVEGATENLISILTWCGIEYDEGPFLDNKGQIYQKGDFGPYIQSQRTEIYKKYAEELLKKGVAYRCFCTPQRLEELRKTQLINKQPPMYDRFCRNLSQKESDEKAKTAPYTIRLKMPDEEIVFYDIIHKEVKFNGKLIDDQILLKSDGFPTYHLANVVDDHLMQITHVIRGEEWLSSTPKHIVLYKYFEWNPPKFAHLPLLLNPDRTKLSKRSGDVAVEDFKKEGFLPEAIINYVALLGWSTEDSQQFFTKEELIEKFSLERCSQSPAIFDKQKMLWMNSEYIRKTSSEKLFYYIKPFLEEANLDTSNKEYLLKLIEAEKERIKLLKDVPYLIEYFLKPDEEITYNEEAVKKFLSTKEQKEILLQLKDLLIKIENFDKITLEKEIREFCLKNNYKTPTVFHPLRVAVSGRTEGIGLFDLLELLGKEKVINRIQIVISDKFLKQIKRS